MSEIRSMPCTACPYRRDVPSGLWAEHEYDKLVDYDAPTADQPMAVFACHATPEHLCHGWAVVHMNRGHDHELLALRIRASRGDWRTQGIPEAGVPLFDSGAAAAEHGKRDITTPSPEAVEAVERLARKHPRLAEALDAVPAPERAAVAAALAPALAPEPGLDAG